MPDQSTLLYRCRACQQAVEVVVPFDSETAIGFLLNRSSVRYDGGLARVMEVFGLEAMHECHRPGSGTFGVMDLLSASPVAGPPPAAAPAACQPAAGSSAA